MGLDGVDIDTIGFVLSLYFIGLIFGAIYSKNLIKKSGHIRMFAGCVALSAVSILVCSLYTDPVLWGVMRVLLGFCNACAFTAMESWLSDSATKENRGKLLSVYHGTALSGLFAGQFLMNAADPQESVLFVLAGIFLCMAVTPIVLSRHKGPVVEDVTTMSIKTLSFISPLGMITCFVSGIVYASMFNLLPVFAKTYAITEFNLSIYVGFAIFGAFIMQFPVGYLSDKYDRRTVLLGMICISLVMCFSITIFADNGLSTPLVIATIFAGGTLACLYPLSVSETLDKLKQSEMVAAMSTMILVQAIGGMIGPLTSSILMQKVGTNALFYFIIVVQIFLAVFVIYRMGARKALPISEQETFVMQTSNIPAASLLDPRTEFIEPTQQLSNQAKMAQELAELDPGAAVKMARAITIDNPELGVEVASAVAKVDGIDVLRFYEVMNEAAPNQLYKITQALVTTNPDLAYELVSKLAQWYPTQVVFVAMQIGEALPELRSEMARIAVESAPESATQVAEYYAKVLSEEQQAIRPADREDDTSDEEALNIATQIWESAPDQAINIAVVMADNMPEAAVDLASELATTFHDPKSTMMELSAQTSENDLAVELVQRIAEVVPDNAAEIAGAVVDVVPEFASEIVDAISEGLSSKEGEWVNLINDDVQK
jgi:MFS family permease